MGALQKALGAACVAAVVTACGGGGGGGSSSVQAAPVTASALVTDATAPELITGFYNSLQFSASLSAEFFALLQELYIGSPIAAGQQPQSAQNLAEAVVVIADRYLNINRQIRVVPSVVITDERVDCDAGFFVFDADIETLDGPTTGDSLFIDFVNCDGFSGVEGFLDGSLSLRVAAATGDRLALELDFGGLTLQDDFYNGTADGDLDVDINFVQGIFIINSRRLDLNEGGERIVLQDYSVTETQDSFVSLDGAGIIGSPDFTAGAGASVPPGVSFLVEENLNTQLGDVYASSGVLVIFGAGDSSLRLTALDDTTVRVEVDADGDMTYETTNDVAWASVAPPPSLP